MTINQPAQTAANSTNEQRIARALQAIEKLQAKLSAVEAEKTEPIAIVGMGCRFPGGVHSPAAFWQLLSEGKDAITQVPSDRWDAHAYYDENPDTPGKIVTRNGGFVGHLKDFDADFFGISPREAISLDPQQRLLLEVSWEAMEHGDMVPAQWTGQPVGIFVGISSSDYSQYLSGQAEADIDAYLATGNAHSVAAGRLSYSLRFTGPSLGVDTACSSSLVAVHLACQSLRSQDCEVALAGGVNRILSPAFSINFSRAHMLAPDGRCKTFDAAADGFARGEGCGVVVLKRLSDAIAQGDNILALLRGSAVNQDGRSGGLTVPNGPSQQAVIRRALANAKVRPEQVSYVEAHGTGTALGDPIEVGALGAVFGQSHTHRQPLKLGSVKTNIGHLEAAAGIAGLIKVVLAMQHETLPAHLHFQQPSPHIDWSALPVKVTDKQSEWTAYGTQRETSDKKASLFAGVSSFGFGGTNAHVIVESFTQSVSRPIVQPVVRPAVEKDDSNNPYHLLTLSAKSPAALKALIEAYVERLEQLNPSAFGDLCWSAWAVRSHFSHRFAIVASSASEAKAQLLTYLESAQNQHSLTQPVQTHSAQDNQYAMLSRLAQQYSQGGDIIWPDIAGKRIDLPTYPFQRESYWIEVPPRQQLSTQTKSSEQSYAQRSSHPLLGDRLSLAGTTAIHFETVITPESVPFLQEHQVFGATVLPAVGYLEMALAASRAIQTNAGTDTDQIAPLVICDVNFHQALLLETAQTVQLVLTPSENQYQFEVFSLSESRQWQRHASGCLIFNPDQSTTLNFPPQGLLTVERLGHCCPSQISVDACYQRLSDQGVTYGQNFRAIQQVYTGMAQALSRLSLPKGLLPTLGTYSLHPVLLDACLQSIAAIFINQPLAETYLPAAIDQVFSHVSSFDDTELWSYVEVTKKDSWLTADIQLVSLAGELLVSLTGLRLQPASMERVLAPRAQRSRLESSPNTPCSTCVDDWFYTIDWQPKPLPVKVELPTAQSVIQQLANDFSQVIAQPIIQSYLNLLPQLEDLSLSYIFKALIRLNHNEILPDVLDTETLITAWEVVPAHHALFRRLVEVVSTGDAPQVLSKTDSLEVQTKQLLNNYPEAKAELTLIQRCGENLADVLQGKTDPLTLLFPEGDVSGLTQLYQSSPGAQLMNQQMQQVVKRMNPSNLRILEIGAGTGGTTAHLLPHVSESDYVFTDISPLFLAKAKERFADYPNLTFERLDIEQPVVSQGFKPGDYDLVIASNVLHATADIEQTLKNVRSLLTPNGQLILLEGTQPLLWLDLIFGMTAGWWKRTTHPLLSVSQWQQHLQEAGYSAAILLAPSKTTESLSLTLPQSIIIATQSSEPATKSNWLILAEPTAELGESLAQELEGKLVWLEESLSLAETLQTVSSLPDQPIPDQPIPDQPIPDQIVYLVGHTSDKLSEKKLSGKTLETLIQKTSIRLLTLLQSWSSRGNMNPQLSIVTQGVTDGAGELTQSPAWGLARVIELEYPALHCRRIDLDPSDAVDTQLRCLCQELQTQTHEKSVVYRQRERRVARLSNHQEKKQLTVPSGPYKLALPTKGSPDNLQLVSTERQQPQPGEVEIRVQAAGLNFIDVLDSLALLPFERDWLGAECAGEIVAVGEGVDSITVGNKVFALAAGSFSQYVTVPVELVVAQPQNLTAAAAATIPANFLTAYYALKAIAALKKGERVLIHAAAGGTGMAAVKIAQQVGAEIYATASPRKWDALRSLGVTHIMNSRTVDFADEIMTKTDGQGVAVVLNALSGEFIEKSLSTLAPNGRFLEIGKRDIWTAEQVAQTRPDVNYHIIDLMSVAQERPAEIQTMLRSLKEQFETQQLSPIPYRTFPLAEAPQAFRHMQQAQHVGKIVLDMTAARSLSVVKNNTLTVTAKGTYLITGGTGGLGLATAEWLVNQGARHLVLLSRGSTMPPAVDSWIQQSLKKDVDIQILQADVAEQAQLASALATIQETMPPLKGVIHAAGILEDGVLQQLTWPKMRKVLAPKVWGAWHLHQLTAELTADDALDFFALYSSAASLLGSPGQGAHVAANSFLDALSHHRHAQGLPAISINWGPWAEIGSAAGEQAQRQMQQRGIDAIAPNQGLQALEKLLTQTDQPQVGVIPINWPIFRQQGLENDPFFSNFSKFETFLARTNQPESNQPAASANWLNQLNSLPERRHTAFLIEALQTEVSKVLGLPGNKRVETTVSFFDMGMDSLMAVELKNQLDIKLGKPIASTDIFEYPTLKTLAAHLVSTVNQSLSANPPPATKRRPKHKHESEEQSAPSPPLSPPKSSASTEKIPKDSTDILPEHPDPLLETTPDIEQELAALETLLNRS